MEFGNPYETEYWKVYSGIMRPGGLELTQRLLSCHVCKAARMCWI